MEATQITIIGFDGNRGNYFPERRHVKLLYAMSCNFKSQKSVRFFFTSRRSDFAYANKPDDNQQVASNQQRSESEKQCVKAAELSIQIKSRILSSPASKPVESKIRQKKLIIKTPSTGAAAQRQEPALE